MDHDQFAVTRTRRVSWALSTLVLAAAGLNTGCELPGWPQSPRLPDTPAVLEFPGIPGVYRIDVQQGNIVDREMLDQLEIGMEPRKVRFILGTPLLVDPFNQNRWVYLYSLRRGSGDELRQRVSVYFVDDRLARIDDRLDPDAVPDLATERAQTRVKVPKHSPPEGFLDRLTPDFLTSGDDAGTDSGTE